MTTVVVYDDAVARSFAPFALTRPVGALRAGASVIAQRWGDAFGATEIRVISSEHLDGFSEGGFETAEGELAAGTIVANARCVVSIGTAAIAGDCWRVDDLVAAVRLAESVPVSSLRDGNADLASLAPPRADVQTLRGRWLNAPWDIVGQLPAQLADDVAALASTAAAAAWQRRDGDGISLLGGNRVAIDPDAVVEPHVVFDTSGGDVVISGGAHIAAFTRIAGPCYIGPGTHVLGGRISGSSIGDDCRVHGDVSASVFVGHCNKAHEGFVGHSVIGRWANLGAGTTTSNLKNSYGSVRMWTPGGEAGTNLMFLGSLIGDHAKLGIGTMLGTGTVVGAGANVYGGVQPPKRVPPFAWGDAPPFATFELAKFLDVAARVMERRKIALDHRMRDVLTAAHSRAGSGAW